MDGSHPYAGFQLTNVGANAGIAYAYIPTQSVTGDATPHQIGTQSGEQYGNVGLFAPALPGQLAFTQQVLVQMALWFPLGVVAPAGSEISFLLIKAATPGIPLTRGQQQMIQLYVVAGYLGIFLPGDTVAMQAMAPSGSIQIGSGGYAAVSAIPI